MPDTVILLGRTWPAGNSAHVQSPESEHTPLAPRLLAEGQAPGPPGPSETCHGRSENAPTLYGSLQSTDHATRRVAETMLQTLSHSFFNSGTRPDCGFRVRLNSLGRRSRSSGLRSWRILTAPCSGSLLAVSQTMTRSLPGSVGQ